MSKETLQQRVLADPRIQIYDCGRQDIQAGAIDRRVLATLEFLVASGFNPTVTVARVRPLVPDRRRATSPSTPPARAVDIAAINGIPILGNQGKGSITELVIQRLLTLQGTMKPHQIISLMDFPDADNTLVAGRPRRPHPRRLPPAVRHQLQAVQAAQRRPQAEPVDRLIERLGKIDNPTVRVEPSKSAIKAKTIAQGPLTDDPRSFRFVQWEFAGRLGPPPGRYVVRRYAGDDVHEVVVVTEADAPRRRARRAPPAGTVPVTRVTVIDAVQRPRRRPPRTGAAAPTPCLAPLPRPPTASPSADPSAPDPGARARRPHRRRARAREVAEGDWTEAQRAARRPSRRAPAAAPSTVRPSGSPRCCRPATSPSPARS